MPTRKPPEKFLVAFSFAGAERELVRAIATAVEQRLGEGTVFFDEWFEYTILAGHDADRRLQEIYGEKSELVVVCVSEPYSNRVWTLAENEFIRARLMEARTSPDQQARKRILPIRVGPGDVDYIPSNAIVPDVSDKPADETARNIVDRLRQIVPQLEAESTMLAKAPATTARSTPSTQADPAPRRFKPTYVVIALILALVAVFFELVLPSIYIREIQEADIEVPWKAHARLKQIPFYKHRADEALAEFWRRHAQRSELTKTRDEALIYRLKALDTAATDARYREAGLLAADEYQWITRTLRESNEVRAVAFSPDGESVLTGSDQWARLWIIATGKPRSPKLRHPHDPKILAVAFSPDGTNVLTGSADYRAQMWEVSTGDPTNRFLRHDDEVLAVAFSRDGQSILTGSDDKTARVWDRKGEAKSPPLEHPRGVTAVAFSPDGQIALTGCRDGFARLWSWSVSTAKTNGVYLQHRGTLNSVAFSPDGNTILTGCYDRTARLWDARTGQQIGFPFRHNDVVVSVAYSPDGKTIATTCQDHAARLWNPQTGELIGLPMWHAGNVLGVAFHPSGNSVLTACEDGTARLWNVPISSQKGISLRHDPDDREVRAAALSQDGKGVLTGCLNGKARFWDAEMGQSLGTPLTNESGIFCVAFSPDGQTVLAASAGTNAHLWNARTRQISGENLAVGGNILCAVFSTNNQAVLTGCDDKTARLWDARTGKAISPSLSHTQEVIAVAISPDGQFLLTGSEDGTAQVWNRLGQRQGSNLPHVGGVTAVAFSPDGNTILTGSTDKIARLWDRSTGQTNGLELLHSGVVTAVRFSPDGKALITATPDRMHFWPWPLPGPVVDVITRWIHAKKPVFQTLNQEGTRVRALEWITGNEVLVRDIRFDQSGDVQLTGEPSTLLNDWIRRLSLDFQNDGVTLGPR